MCQYVCTIVNTSARVSICYITSLHTVTSHQMSGHMPIFSTGRSSQVSAHMSIIIISAECLHILTSVSTSAKCHRVSPHNYSKCHSLLPLYASRLLVPLSWDATG